MKFLFFMAFFSSSLFATTVDYCLKEVSSNDYRMKGLRQCKDGTKSFYQPDSTGINGYEGYCGQTSVSNIVYSYCKIAFHPVIDIDGFFKDVGPGVSPRTMRDGLNDIFQSLGHSCPQNGEWKRISLPDAKSYLEAIKAALKAPVAHKHQNKRFRSDGKLSFTTPISALIANGNYLHWITLVDVIQDEKQCKVIYIDYGTQSEIDCSELKKISAQVGTKWSPVLNAYTLITYE